MRRNGENDDYWRFFFIIKRSDEYMYLIMFEINNISFDLIRELYRVYNYYNKFLNFF